MPNSPELRTPETMKAWKQWSAYVHARDEFHSDWVRDANKFDRFFRGEQWDDDALSKLEAEKRPALTFNLILSTINAVLGYYQGTQQEVLFKPRGKGANEDVANTLNSLFLQIAHNNRSHWKEEQLLMDGLITDRGFLDIRISFDDNLQGEIRETVLDPRDVIIDTEARDYDPSTWNEVFITRWMTVDEIAATFGEKYGKQLRNRGGSMRFAADSIEFQQETFGGERGTGYGAEWQPVEEDGEYAVRRVRVIERQLRKLDRRRYFVDPEAGDMRPIPTHWEDEPGRPEAFAEQIGLEIIARTERRIRMTITADDLVLFDDWSLYEDLTVVPFFPTFRRGRPIGLVRNLISAQEMVNKVSSQELHVVNTTANSGWIFEEDSLANMDADELQERGAETGLVLEVRRNTTTAPQKIQPNQIPQGLMQVSAKANTYFREISGVTEAFLGIAKREVSGVSIDAQRQGNMVQLEPIFANLAKTRQLRAELMLKLIQAWYSETRVVSITLYDLDGHEMTEEVQLNQPTPQGTIVNDLTLGEYSVVVSSQPRKESRQDATFGQLMQMREAGVYIPDWVVIENSQLPNKRIVSEIVKKVEGMAEPTPEEVEMQMKMEQLQLMMVEAQLSEMMARAQEREANTQLLLAKAGDVGAEHIREMEKLGMEMRADLEKRQQEVQQKREELEARMEIARQKNEANIAVAQFDSGARRVDSALKRDTDLQKASMMARARSPRSPNTGQSTNMPRGRTQ